MQFVYTEGCGGLNSAAVTMTQYLNPSGYTTVSRLGFKSMVARIPIMNIAVTR
jgi:hypothetical protein